MRVLDVWLLLHHFFPCRHITKITFRVYIVQLEGGEYYYTLHLIRCLFTCWT